MVKSFLDKGVGMVSGVKGLPRVSYLSIFFWLFVVWEKGGVSWVF